MAHNTDLFCLDKIGRKTQIKKLNSDETLLSGIGLIEFPNFGSLADILAGSD